MTTAFQAMPYLIVREGTSDILHPIAIRSYEKARRTCIKYGPGAVVTSCRHLRRKYGVFVENNILAALEVMERIEQQHREENKQRIAQRRWERTLSNHAINS